MNKQAEKFIINYLKKNLDESEKMWDGGISKAQIVGYLQGTLKSLIYTLEK